MNSEGVPAQRLKLLAPIHRGDDERLTLNGPRGQVVVDDQSKMIEPMLAQFDGFTDTSDILSQLSDEALVADLEELVDYLRLQKILVPTHRQFEVGHFAGANPQTFDSGSPFSDVARLQAPSASASSDAVRGLARLASDRRSCRAFEKERQVPRDDLVDVLRISQSRVLKPTALAGAIQAVRLILLRRELDNGWTRSTWNPRQEKFDDEVPETTYDERQIKFALDNEDALFDAPSIIVITANLEIHAQKYANRGYRYALMEVGQVAQMLVLAATEAGLSSVEYGGFRDGELASLLALKPGDVPLLVVGLGHAARAGRPLSVQVTDALYKLMPWQERNAERFSFVGRKEPTVDATSIGVTIAQCQFGDEASPGNSRFATGVAISSSRATVRAVAEAVERVLSGELRVDAVGTEADLPSGSVVPAISTLTYSDARAFKESSLFAPYSPTRRYQWVEGYKTGGRRVFLPIELVYYPIPIGQRIGPLCGAASSSGVAAGATAGEAEAAALAELIERDAFVRAWMGRLAPSRWLKLPAWAARLALEWERRDIVMGVYVFSSPALATVGVSLIGSRFPRLCWGMSSTHSLETSLEKAYEEACGSFVGSSGVSDAVEAEDVRGPLDHARYYWSGDALDDIKWFFAGEEAAPKEPLEAKFDQVRQTASYFNLGGNRHGYPLEAVRAVHEGLKPIWFGTPLAPALHSAPPHFFP